MLSQDAIRSFAYASTEPRTQYGIRAERSDRAGHEIACHSDSHRIVCIGAVFWDALPCHFSQIGPCKTNARMGLRLYLYQYSSTSHTVSLGASDQSCRAKKIGKEMAYPFSDHARQLRVRNSLRAPGHLSCIIARHIAWAKSWPA